MPYCMTVREMSTQAHAATAPSRHHLFKVSLSLANEQDRETIYGMRYDVYADELRQYPANTRKQLRDDLDNFNWYIVAKADNEIVGFISITPPDSPRFSVNKYFAAEALPFAMQSDVYETRLLTVAPHYRGKYIASALMYAAIRWIEARGGSRVVVMGRREIMQIYQHVGLQPMGTSVKAGAVTYELMAGQIRRLQQGVSGLLTKIRKQGLQLDWQLDIPFRTTTGCHHGGASFDAIGTEFDALSRARHVISADVLDAWFPPSPKVTAALQEHLPWIVRTSPPADASGLIRSIARMRDLPTNCILPAAGSTDLIFTAFKKWLRPDSRVLILDPTYGEYAYITEQLIGCDVHRFVLSPENHFTVNLEKFEARLNHGYDLVVIVNPNNPTGQYIPGDRLAQILVRAPTKTKFWIDEAYLDYVSGARSLEHVAATHDNLFVSKSLSKVFGLSGLRVGYLCGNPANIAELKMEIPPWAVNLPAQIAAIKALQDRDYYEKRYQQTRDLRSELRDGLAGIQPQLRLFPSVTNFILCFLPRRGPCTETVLRRCRKHDLYLRDATTMGTHLGYHAIRIAVKDRKTNAKTVRILSQVLTTK